MHRKQTKLDTGIVMSTAESQIQGLRTSSPIKGSSATFTLWKKKEKKFPEPLIPHHTIIYDPDSSVKYEWIINFNMKYFYAA